MCLLFTAYADLQFYLDGVDELPVDVQRGHAVLQHAFAHDQHQVVPLALGDQLATAEASAAGKDLIEGGFFARLIRCLIGRKAERSRATSVSQRAPAEASLLAGEEACAAVTVPRSYIYQV